MTNRLSIHLIICTYNKAALLDRTLTAISKQRVPSEVVWGVLVVNNNCTDETAAVVEEHIKSKKIPNLSMVLEPKQGLTPARLCGVRNSNGDWIAFVDDDCLLEKDWIAQAAQFALAHPDCGAIGGRVIPDWEKPPPAYVLKYGYSFAEQEHGTIPKKVNFLVGAGLIINRSAIIGCGWMDKQFLADRVGKKLVSGGDVEIALRIAAKYELWYTPELRIRHIIPPGRTSQKYLMEINYGLGSSKLYGNSMLWAGSYPSWLLASVFGGLRSSGDIIFQALRTALGRSSAIEAAINASFLCGWWAGIWSLLRMDAQDRRALLGCAVAA